MILCYNKAMLSEYHIHLEGALSLDFFLKLYRESQPEFAIKNVLDLFDYQDFSSFIKLWLKHQELLFNNTNDLEKRILEMGLDFKNRLILENITYSEVHISPIDALFCRYKKNVLDYALEYEKILLAWDNAFSRINSETTQAFYIVDLVLNYADEVMHFQWELIKKLLKKLKFIKGIGIGGGGKTTRTRLDFKQTFQEARALGLLTVCHAGELPPKEKAKIEVLEAIEIGVARIGHGIHGIDDPKIIDLLLKKNIMLEICPSSNLFTKSISNLAELPIKLIKANQLNYSINSDDPTYFKTTLAKEYELVKNL